MGRARDAYEMLGGYSLESKVRSVLFGLGFTERDMTRSTVEGRRQAAPLLPTA